MHSLRGALPSPIFFYKVFVNLCFYGQTKGNSRPRLSFPHGKKDRKEADLGGIQCEFFLLRCPKNKSHRAGCSCFSTAALRLPRIICRWQRSAHLSPYVSPRSKPQSPVLTCDIVIVRKTHRLSIFRRRAAVVVQAANSEAIRRTLSSAVKVLGRCQVRAGGGT